MDSLISESCPLSIINGAQHLTFQLGNMCKDINQKWKHNLKFFQYWDYIVYLDKRIIHLKKELKWLRRPPSPAHLNAIPWFATLTKVPSLVP